MSLHPKYVFAIHNYASYLREKGDINKAIQLLETSLKLEPNFVGGHRTLSYLYKSIQREEKSILHEEMVRKIKSRYNREDYSNDPYLYQLLL